MNCGRQYGGLFYHLFAIIGKGWDNLDAALIGGIASGLAFGPKLKGIADEFAERNQL